MKKNSVVILLIFLILSFSFLNAQVEEEKSKSTLTNSVMLQPITVTVGGNFIVTGSFLSSASTRVDQFVTQLYAVGTDKAKGSLQEYWAVRMLEQGFSEFPLRDITLKRMDGAVKKIDLLKFRLTGDFELNPYLRNDDVIIFPDYDITRTFIDISGAVNKSAKFQYMKGDKLSDAILFAGGINPAYDNVIQAMISRLDASGINEQRIIVNIVADPELKMGDRIKILADENQKKSFKALVLGEVKNPGYVYLKKDGTYLREVIDYAGGYTKNADLRRAEIIRSATTNDLYKRQEYYREFLIDKNLDLEIALAPKEKMLLDQLSMQRLSNLVQEDSLFFSIDNTLRSLKNEKMVEFQEIYNPESQAGNFLVKDGDLILVPQPFNYVYVFGQVPRAGYIPFEEGQDYKYYLLMSGGLAETARDFYDVVIIKGTTRNWISENKENVKIESGDFIYVPKEVPRSFNFYLQRVSSIAGIIGSIATVVLLLTQFGK